MQFADVIIPLGVENFFTYSVPTEFEGTVAVGGLVVVSFVKNKRYTGVVYALHSNPPVGFETRPIERVIEEGFALSASHLKFLLWLSEYYMAPPGEVTRAALPVAMRLESYTSLCLAADWQEDGTGGVELSPMEWEVIGVFRQNGEICMAEVEKLLRRKDVYVAVRSLLEQGIIQVKESVDDLFKPKLERLVRWARAFSGEELGEIMDSLKRAKAQQKMLCDWIMYCDEHHTDSLPKAEFTGVIGNSTAALKGLCERGVLEVATIEVSRLDSTGEEVQEMHALSGEQERALEQARGHFKERDCVLLQGVTSSGKTEVYIHLIEETIRQGKQVLYLLPEIALTVQIVKRLRRVFGDRVGVYHSGMTDSARAEMWRRQNGENPYPVVLGVRSSIFLPYRDLGLVIIDEEHEASYKQKEPAPRYHGRDAAIMLGKMNGAKILLGSATPSFESYQNAMSGKYGFVELTTRFGEVMMPELMFVDVKEYRRKKMMKGSFTPVLYEEMKRVLERGMQVILFQNRRGYSTFLQCNHCGAILKCKHCDVSMTYYRFRNTLNCHYCGSLRPVPTVCEECGQGHYVNRTPGTERIEEEVKQYFPEARVARMDLEVMSNKVKFRALIEEFEAGNLDILIGTQMVSKGLDFERVKLVGVMDADSLVSFPDFRAEERAYDMLMQVSGRSGRKGEQGKVVIQVADRENRVYRLVEKGSFHGFYSFLSREREMFHYPPFSRLIQIELRHVNEYSLRNAANELARKLRERLERRVCGPAEPEVARVRKMYRIQVLIKAEQGLSLSKLKTFIRQKCDELLKGESGKGLKVYFDVDPL
ncbi:MULTISPECIES: replication restart helicase PriA [Butyricimonas]|uniref:replication restart helicase PriA n=1 Tax=Butyricimonas TaxID=574697 RepID=UPI001D077C69|nr:MULTISPECIES: primosomal protein N' [Butyricimonas]MCB6971488.1 primosomal protein N' [Butyricimonas synergistica]MCG4518202.1 primosomal protein N' [Butyricimonas sp. DFI.6.44]